MKSENLKIKQPSISDISSWENENFYSDDESTFFTISDFIGSYENHEQNMFNVKARHSIFDTPLQIEKNILEVAIWTVGDDEDDDEQGSIYDLVKLSSCTHYMDKYKPRDRNKIISFTERQRGKWYFQPDQRCEVVQSFIDEDSRIGSMVLPYSEMIKKIKGDRK